MARQNETAGAMGQGVRRALGGAALALVLAAGAQVQAQDYQFSTVTLSGNERVDLPTVLSYAGLPERGAPLSAGELNAAYQRIVASGLFERVTLTPEGETLRIEVVEYPTISVISIEGNSRIDDDVLSGLLSSKPRRVYSPQQAEADAEIIAQAYEQQGRLAATVTPRIIRRSENRVDLVFEVVEAAVVEIERISFVGNRDFSDRRLRRVLASKQAGLLRAFIRADTYIADRVEFDKQVLRDFYLARGYVDFEVLSVARELTRTRDAFLLTFNVREGQKFRLGELSVESDLPEVDTALFAEGIAVRSGATYAPTLVENTITRLERLALREGLDFIRVTPRITRNDETQTLDVAFVLERGPRIFVERIDIEGNATTLDRVIRRQFVTVEGDPFNPREIRAAAERIRALGFFETAEVSTREGTSPEGVIVDVDVTEAPTGSLSFGLSYSAARGAGAAINYSERNFLGRGQLLSFAFDTGVDNSVSQVTFAEPAFLGRDVTLRFSARYAQTDNENDEKFATDQISITPSLEFPISAASRLALRATLGRDELSNYQGSSAILRAEEAQGGLNRASLGYTFNHDSRRTGLDPDTFWLARLSQDYAGLGGDVDYIETTAFVAGQTSVLSGDITLRAELEGGVLSMLGDDPSRFTDRYTLAGKIRGFEPGGIGPRDPAASGGEALGGNLFAVARLEANFPIGLPEEYGISGGVFADAGSVWGLDATGGGVDGLDVVDDGFNLRAAVGVSVFWETPIGPLRFNFSNAVVKEEYDETRGFDLTISTRF